MLRLRSGPQVASRYRPQPDAAFVGVVPFVLVTAAWGLLLALETGSATTQGTDFFYYYAVSRLVALGHAPAVYDLAAIRHVEHLLATHIGIPNGVIPNVYPPFFVVALAPLAAFPYTSAYLIWLGLSCLWLGLSLAVLQPIARISGRLGRVSFLLLALFSLPVIVALLQGQVSALLLFLLVVTLLALTSEHEIVAGLALALTLVKPQFVLAFLIVLVVYRRWKALLTFAAAGLALFLLPVALVGWGAQGAYLRTLLSAASWGSNVGGFAPIANRSFAGFAQLLLPRAFSTPAAALFDFLALAVLVLASLRRGPIELAFGLAVVVSLLASQHVLIHDLTLLLIPAAVALRYREQGPAGITLFLLLLDAAIYIGFRPPATFRVQLPTVAMCALSVWLLLTMVRPRVEVIDRFPNPLVHFGGLRL